MKPSNYYSECASTAPQQNAASGLGSYASELHSTIAELGARIDSLEKAIGTILIPTPPQGASGGNVAAPAPMRSQASESVTSAQQAVAGLCARVDAICSRVDL